MAQPGSARRYAQAAFEIAREKKALDRWQADLTVLAAAAGEPELRAVLESPKVVFEEKAKLLAVRLQGVDQLVLNLGYLLIARHRLGLAPQMVADFKHLVEVERGIRHAVVTTAIPLKPEEQQALSRSLSQIIGGKVVMENRVDEQIIGGLVARIDDKLLDGSTRSRLQALKKNLAESRSGSAGS